MQRHQSSRPLLRWFAILWIGFIDIGLTTHDLSTPKRLMVCTVPGRKGGSSCRKVRDSSWGLPMAQYYYWPFQKLRNIFCNILYMIHGFASGAGAFKTKRVGHESCMGSIHGRGSGMGYQWTHTKVATRIVSTHPFLGVYEPFLSHSHILVVPGSEKKTYNLQSLSNWN